MMKSERIIVSVVSSFELWLLAEAGYQCGTHFISFRIFSAFNITAKFPFGSVYFGLTTSLLKSEDEEKKRTIICRDSKMRIRAYIS